MVLWLNVGSGGFIPQVGVLFTSSDTVRLKQALPIRYTTGVGSLFRMRPQYELRVASEAREVRAKVSKALAVPGTPCRGQVEDHRIVLMTRSEHHFWSPELRMRVTDEEDGCLLTGRFGPRPAVWTMFAVIYAHLAFICVAGAVYAMAQLTLGRSPTALLAVPICVVVALVVRVIAGVGQNLGSDEMVELRRFVAQTVDS